MLPISLGDSFPVLQIIWRSSLPVDENMLLSLGLPKPPFTVGFKPQRRSQLKAFARSSLIPAAMLLSRELTPVNRHLFYILDDACTVCHNAPLENTSIVRIIHRATARQNCLLGFLPLLYV
jgi:hypothetical protein